MKKYFTLFIILPYILFAQPKIEVVGGEVYDWGEVEQSSGPLKAIIIVKNVGNEMLKIFSVKPGCGCTTAPLDKTELQPGEEGKLDVTLQINKDSGKLTKGITLTTNDPNKDKLDVLLKAKVLVPISLFPKTVAFGSIDLKKENVAKMVISNNVNRDIKIKTLIYPKDKFTTNLKNGMVFKAGTDFTLEVKLKKKLKLSGNLAELITIETDDKASHIVQIQVWGTVE